MSLKIHYKKFFNSYYLGIFAACILALTYQLILFSKGFYSISADEALHTLRAYNWYRGDHSLFSMWLPFYKIFLGTIFHISHNLFITPRVVSFLFGILNILALTWISHQLFNEKVIDLLTALLGAFFAPIIILSVIPLMGIIYSFFVIMFFGFLLKWFSDKKSSSLYLSLFWIALSSTVRFEGWIFSFLIFLIILYSFFFEKEEFKLTKLNLLFSVLILGVFPVIWFFISYIHTGSIFGFAAEVAGQTRKGYFISTIKNNVLYQFFQINISSLNILGIISIIYFTIKDKKISKFSAAAFISLFIMALLSFYGKAMPNHNYWRIAAVWCILLIPFTAHWIYSLLNDNPDKKYFAIIGFILILLVTSFSFINQTNRMSENSYMTKSELGAGKYLNNLFDAGKINSDLKVLIESDNWTQTGIIVASQHPEYFIWNTNIKTGGHLIKTSHKEINISEIQNQKIKLLVFEKKEIKDVLNESRKMKILKRFNNWVIYEMN